MTAVVITIPLVIMIVVLAMPATTHTQLNATNRGGRPLCLVSLE